MNQLPITLNFRSKEPLVSQLQAQIRDRIEQGLLLPGDQLPAVRALAAQLQVNFNTVARAYRALDEAGLISTRQGRGTYILDPALFGSSQDAIPDARNLERDLRQKLAVLCQQARRSGIALQKVRQIVDQQMRQAQGPCRSIPRPKLRVSRKRLYSTPARRKTGTPVHKRSTLARHKASSRRSK